MGSPEVLYEGLHGGALNPQQTEAGGTAGFLGPRKE